MLKSFLNRNTCEAGCDEAGRGCLAGPVVAAAVILPQDYYHKALNDSKQLTEKQRYKLREIILKESLDHAVAFIDHQMIDKINILNASIKAMHIALDKLNLIPDHILVDGNRFKPYAQIPYTCIIKGDSKYLSIAAASILAKTYRDDYMLNLHELYPQYCWNKNKGYPVERHREAISKYGLSPYHRLSFKLSETQTKFNFE